MRGVAAIEEHGRSQEAIAGVLTLILCAVFAAVVPGFFTGENILALMQSGVTLGLLGLGMGLVVISRGIDLSMIAIMSCPTSFVLDYITRGWSVGTACALGLGLAVSFGLLNGLLIAYARLSPLFATLATGLALYGLATTFLSNDIIGWPAALAGWSAAARSQVAGFPVPLIVFAAAAAALAVFLNRTRLGRFVYAMGDNPLSAVAVGIPTKRITVLIYLMSAMIAFGTGLMTAAILQVSAARIYNSTILYEVILVVVLGGIGLSGGRGGALSVVLGTLLIATISNAMTLMNIGGSVRNLIMGMLLLTAVIIDSRLSPRNEETAQQGDI